MEIRFEKLLGETWPEPVLVAAAGCLMKEDRIRFEEWAEDSLTGDAVLSVVAPEAVAFYLEEGEMGKVLGWLKRVRDVDEVGRLRMLIWTSLDEAIRHWVRADGVKAMERILGAGELETYWVSRTFDVWLAVEAREAREWYEETKEGLPKEAREQLVVSFFKRSVATGKRAYAERWLSQVNDEGIRSWIQGEYGDFFEGAVS
jgi:hypothetical protein